MARVAKKKASTRRGAAMAKVRKGRKPVPANETKHERFIRLGTKRMNNVIRQIQLLGNLCGPNYDCEPDDLTSMHAAVVRELDMAFARFTPRKREAAGTGFSFGQSHTAHLAS